MHRDYIAIMFPCALLRTSKFWALFSTWGLPKFITRRVPILGLLLQYAFIYIYMYTYMFIDLYEYV